MFGAAAVEKVGTVKAYGGSTAPDGWLFCDGSAISRTTYAELFAVIGTTYGSGDGTTTFNIPNGKMPLGVYAPIIGNGEITTIYNQNIGLSSEQNLASVYQSGSAYLLGGSGTGLGYGDTAFRDVGMYVEIQNAQQATLAIIKY